MIDDIRVLPTEAEVASIIDGLAAQHALIIRRLAYQRDRLQATVNALTGREAVKAMTVTIVEWVEENELETSTWMDCELAAHLVSALREVKAAAEVTKGE